MKFTLITILASIAYAANPAPQNPVPVAQVNAGPQGQQQQGQQGQQQQGKQGQQQLPAQQQPADFKCDMAHLKDSADTCAKIDTDCLTKLPIKDLTASCLAKIPESSYSKMSSKTAAQFLSLSVKDLPADPKFFHALFKRVEWKGDEEFLVNLTKDPAQASIALEGLANDPEDAARLFNVKTAEHHGKLCGKLTPEIIGLTTTSFFAKMKAACMKEIPDLAFKGFDSDRLAAISPENIRTIRVKQLVNIPDASFAGFTSMQAKGFPDYNPPEGEDKDAKQKYLDDHVCSQFKRMSVHMQKQAKLSLEAHCKVNSSAASSTIDFNYGRILAATSFVAALTLLL